MEPSRSRFDPPWGGGPRGVACITDNNECARKLEQRLYQQALNGTH